MKQLEILDVTSPPCRKDGEDQTRSHAAKRKVKSLMEISGQFKAIHLALALVAQISKRMSTLKRWRHPYLRMNSSFFRDEPVGGGLAGGQNEGR